jgi:hypothetical protein
MTSRVRYLTFLLLVTSIFIVDGIAEQGTLHFRVLESWKLDFAPPKPLRCLAKVCEL